MPPRGQTIYSTTAGVPLYFNENHVFPDRVPIGILAASASRRIPGHSAVTLGLSKLGSVALLQSEYIFLGRQISLQPTGSIGSQNTHATAIRGSWARARFNANVTGEWFKSGVRSSVGNGEFELFRENNTSQSEFPFGKTTMEDSKGIPRANYRCAGLADMADTIITGRLHRCNMDVALHVVDILTSIECSPETRKRIDMSTICERPDALTPEQAQAMLNTDVDGRPCEVGISCCQSYPPPGRRQWTSQS